jgi:ubiquitin-like 1-activating enzyme E1 B
MVGTTESADATVSLLKGLRLTVGEALFGKITSCKILLVGSGGIGCELLKNLALSGFTHVEVIDLDTIDVSNLNRQFLFRSQHVGMPKCTVACNVALAMLPVTNTATDKTTPSSNRDAKYLAHHGNVCDNSRFNVNYVKSFDLVLNALDNVAARRRVNRLCLAASVPLVEAGTTGYLGQVTVIDKASNTECYECQVKPTQKVYPICTIRSTPSMPVHTIVWAKELYKLFFGPKVEESMLFEDQTGDEKSTYMDLVMDLRSQLESKGDAVEKTKLMDVAGKVLTALYHTEIQKQLAMDRFKTAQKVPTSISIEMIQKVVDGKCEAVPSKQSSYKQTDIPSKEDCITEVISCVMDAAEMLQSGEKLLAEFDKDDKLAMRLVTFASNLRSYVFGIEPIQSNYSAKGIAGNIIPAIATTNAIVAGLQILQAFQILKKQVEKKEGELRDVCRYTYVLRNKSRKGFYLQPTSLPEPNPKCFVCKNAVINLTVNTETWTLEMLLRRVIKKALGFMEPSLLLGSSIIYEEGEGIEEDEYSMNVPKKLIHLPCGGVKAGSVIRIEDFTQDLEVDMCINHQSEWEQKDDDAAKDEEEKFIIGGEKPVVAKKQDAQGDANDNDDDDIEMIVPESQSAAISNGKKRAAIDIVDDIGEGGQKKKLRIE